MRTIQGFGGVLDFQFVDLPHFASSQLDYPRLPRIEGTVPASFGRGIPRPINGHPSIQVPKCTRRGLSLLYKFVRDPPVDKIGIWDCLLGKWRLYILASQLKRPRFGWAGLIAPSIFSFPWLSP